MEINLYNNQLTQLPESLSQLYNLTTLDLSGNQLTQLPDNLETVTSITILRALWNVWQEKTDSVTVDSLRLLHADMARLNERLVQLLEQNGSDSDAADLCSLLARSYLISEQYQHAESALEKGEALEVEHSYLKAIRPHLLLFQGQYEAAQEKYLALKNEPFDPNSIYATFKEAFLADFADFEKMGVLPEHCKAQVEEIKRLLNEE